MPTPTVDDSTFPFPTMKSAGTDRHRPERREACLIYIYPTGPLMGRRYPLADGPVLIGRNDDCQVQNVDASVSRHHARIELRDGAYRVNDLGSTNGSFVNNAARPDAALEDGDYLRIGNCIYRFLASGNLEAEYHEEIYRLTIQDGLTGVANRRHFEEFLEREVARAVRHRRGLALAMLDIDHFKQINDRYGHLAGDMTLRQVAATVNAIVRRDELLARYGGEEFALVLPEATVAQAAAVGERLRAAVEGRTFTFHNQTYPVTVSVGIAAAPADGIESPADLVRAADAQLYRAKATGRNRVCAPIVPDRRTPVPMPKPKSAFRLPPTPAAALTTHG